MFELPEHLSSLNALTSPSNVPVMDQSAEDAVWNYLNTDELFRNFGAQPSEFVPKEDKLSPSSEDKKSSPPSDLKSFIEQFAADNNHAYTPDFSLALQNYTSAPTPAGVNTSDVMPNIGSSSWTETESPEEEDRPSGAKKLKQMGAAPAEIEEDKRRRNTEASARFRAKKKEREQNLERRAKDLEAQVAQLAADKASLENENRLLKAIVLGGNGGQPGADQAIASIVGKRKRD